MAKLTLVKVHLEPVGREAPARDPFFKDEILVPIESISCLKHDGGNRYTVAFKGNFTAGFGFKSASITLGADSMEVIGE